MTFRYSSALQALLKNVSTNESAALRALTLIGADAVGLDLSTVLPDLRQAMGTDVPLEIHTALQQIYQRVAQQAAASLNIQKADQGSTARPASGTSEESDQQDEPTASTVMPDNPPSQSPVPDNDPLADLGVEYG